MLLASAPWALPHDLVGLPPQRVGRKRVARFLLPLEVEAFLDLPELWVVSIEDAPELWVFLIDKFHEGLPLIQDALKVVLRCIH